VRSLRSRLFVLWFLSLAASLAVGVLLVGLYRQSSSAQLASTETTVAEACDAIADRFSYYAAGWAGPAPGENEAAFHTDLAAVVDFAMADYPGLGGGIWRQDEGPLATTAPLGGGLRDSLAALVAEAGENDRDTAERLDADAATLLLQGCPLRGPVPGLVAFTFARVEAAPGQGQLQLGLGVLFCLALGMTALVTWLVAAWSRRISAIEAALAQHEAGTLPHLAATGERELDRIVTALNVAGERLEAAHRRSDELAARVALGERLAALGRVTAGVAHEIRNPIAAMRLKAENALAGDDGRRRAALDAILVQIARLDRLLSELLAMTQRREPVPAPTDLAVLLDACAADQQRAGITIRVECEVGTVSVDADLLHRALDNLVANAVAHTPPGGTVTLHADYHDATLSISVSDTGPGIAAELRPNLFEPFVSGRAGGTGLGLAIARELAEAHGGSLTLTDPGGEATGHGAVFTLEVPCPPS
jgi:signal transduction histidine kinase